MAITSFAFVLVLVPEPVWKNVEREWSSSLPSATSSAACTISAARSHRATEIVIRLRGRPFDQAKARINGRRKSINRLPEIQNARCVEAPEAQSPGANLAH